MATNLGSLILELGIDDSKYKAQLKQAQNLGLKTARDIENKFNLNNLPELKLKTIVDDSRLTELNRHLESKREHVHSIQADFNRYPLTPQVDFRPA